MTRTELFSEICEDLAENLLEDEQQMFFEIYAEPESEA